MWAPVWESWRTYLSFALVGAIFIVCQVLSGGGPGRETDANSADPGDRTYRDALRIETAGQGSGMMPTRWLVEAAGDSQQTD